MKTFRRFLFAAVLLSSLTGPASAQNAAVLSPGPENGGLRMGFTLTPDVTTKTCRAQIDLTNVSDKPLTLRGEWRYDEQKGDLKEYLEAATGIETSPAIEPWSGQVQMGQRSCAQPQLTLKAGESVSVEWKTDGKRLKNRVSDPLSVQNPDFSAPGLYSVHAVLAISTGGEPVLLRSNEQFFSSGGSRALPKSTYGQIVSVDAKAPTAVVNLGSLQKVQKGDQFRIRTGYSEYYRLSITDAEPSWSTGILFPEPLPAESSVTVPYPRAGQGATLAETPMPVPAALPPAPKK